MAKRKNASKTNQSATRNSLKSRTVRNKKGQPRRIFGLRPHHISGIALVAIAAGVITFVTGNRYLDSRAASCTVSGMLVNSCRPWLGGWANGYPQAANNPKDQILYQESRIGRQLDFAHTYHSVGSNTLSANDKFFINRANTYLYTNWKPAGSWASADGSDSSINAGIDSMADSIKSVAPKKILMSVFHEPENDVSGGASGCSSSVYKGNTGTPAQYRAMWQNVRNRFDAKGVNNVVWVMNYMGFSNWNCMVDDLWPGNNLVDWIVWDPYASGSKSFNTMMNEFYSYLSSNSDSSHNYLSKPWGIGEWGTYKMTDAQFTGFYDQAKTAVANGDFPKVKLYTLFDADGTLGDHRIGYNGGSTYNTSIQSHYAAFATQLVSMGGSSGDDGGSGGGSGGSGGGTPTPPPADTTKPTVKITSPGNNATVGGTITITGTASDNVSVKAVTLRVDDKYIATDETAPYSFSLDTTKYSDGNHTLVLRAFDPTDNMGESATITIQVNNAASPGGDGGGSNGGNSGSGGSSGGSGSAGGNTTTVISTQTGSNSSANSSASSTRSKPIPVGKTVIVKPSTPGSTVSVQVDGKPVNGTAIDTTDLTNGTHTLTITENGQTKDVEISVNNPWRKALINEIKARPVAYSTGGGLLIGVILALWLFRSRIYYSILRFKDRKLVRFR